MNQRTNPAFGIYALNFENGDRAEVEAFEPLHAEALACQLTGHRAASHCEYLRRPTSAEMQSEKPFAQYYPHQA